MVRTGRKYDIEMFREEALFRLKAEFPSTVEEWTESVGLHQQIKHHPGFCFDVINLALEANLQTILPSAYFYCTQYFVRLSLWCCTLL